MWEKLVALVQKLKKKSKKAYLSGSTMVAPSEQYDIAVSNPLVYDTAETTPQYKKAHSEDKRIAKKPIELVKEVIDETPIINIHDIGAQIKAVEKRRRLLRTELDMQVTPDEDKALIFLKARQKYTQYKDLFNKYPVTTKEKLQELCNTYQVRVVGFQSYYKNVPTEALEEVEKYMQAHRKVCEAAPQFQLIIDDGGKETKKDPILIVQSPFGQWYYILGAWDKEIEIVDDLIYKGK